MNAAASKATALAVAACACALLAGGGYLAWSLKFSPEAKALVAIKELANDPASVVVRDLRRSKKDASIWCGEINARNKMGGMTGFQKFILNFPDVRDASLPAHEERELMKLLIKMTFEDDMFFGAENYVHCRRG